MNAKCISGFVVVLILLVGAGWMQTFAQDATGNEPLAKLQKLRSLTLLTPKVSDEAVSRLRARLPVGCRFVDKRDHGKYENDR